jgi:hypothetical protein
MPLMQWFRGVTLEVTRDDGADAISAHADLDMVHLDITPPAEEGEGGSFFTNLLGSWGKSDNAKSAEKKDELPVPKPVKQ